MIWAGVAFFVGCIALGLSVAEIIGIITERNDNDGMDVTDVQTHDPILAIGYAKTNAELMVACRDLGYISGAVFEHGYRDWDDSGLFGDLTISQLQTLILIVRLISLLISRTSL